MRSINRAECGRFLPKNQCKIVELAGNAKCRTERKQASCDYPVNNLEMMNMPVTQRCNYAGTLGKPVPTRSRRTALAGMLVTRLRRLATLPRRAESLSQYY
jgi:hypothetical protein